jgi:hypothetical protein
VAEATTIGVGWGVLLLVLPALAHGTLYATSGLTSAPGDAAEMWALAGG